MKDRLIKFLLIIFALAVMRGPGEICVGEETTEAAITSAVAEPESVTSGHSEDDCGCEASQCSSVCQTCFLPPLLAPTVTQLPGNHSIASQWSDWPSATRKFSYYFRLLDPPRSV